MHFFSVSQSSVQMVFNLLPVRFMTVFFLLNCKNLHKNGKSIYTSADMYIFGKNAWNIFKKRHIFSYRKTLQCLQNVHPEEVIIFLIVRYTLSTDKRR